MKSQKSGRRSGRSKKKLTPRELAWEKIFKKHQVLKRVNDFGYCDLTSAQLKEFYEPRLLVKFDHSKDLPRGWQKQGLGIITVSDKLWRIGCFSTFASLPPWAHPTRSTPNFSIPRGLESLSVSLITGEGAVMNAALASGILGDFCGEELAPTITGKGRSGKFSFQLTTKLGIQQVIVDSAQIEVDAGYESASALWLFEAKRRMEDDFNLRQLYFPYRAWSQRVSKTIRTVYLSYSNQVFDLYEFEFKSPTEILSGTLTRHQQYVLGDFQLPGVKGIGAVKKRRRASERPRELPSLPVPSPQADDFGKVIALVEALYQAPLSVAEIAEEYGFDERQADYYFNAARFLGLARKGPRRLRQITPLGLEILKLNYAQRHLRIAAILLQDPLIAWANAIWNKRGIPPTLDEFARRYERSPHAERLKSSKTIRRRSQTLLSWLKWVRAALGS